MVFVEGERTPGYKHSTLSGAELEAKRLTETLGKPSYVLASIKKISLPDKFVIKDMRPSEDLPF